MGKLAALHADQTERLILDGAVQLLEQASVSALTVREVARTAGLSERTVFRYFATREELVEAVAREVTTHLRTPAPPESVAELLGFPRALYGGLEARAKLARAALHSELSEKIRPAAIGERWKAVRKILDQVAPRAPEQQKKFAAANIRFYLSATAWQYYRFYFGFSLEETVECAERAIGRELASIRQQNAVKRRVA